MKPICPGSSYKRNKQLRVQIRIEVTCKISTKNEWVIIDKVDKRNIGIENFHVFSHSEINQFLHVYTEESAPVAWIFLRIFLASNVEEKKKFFML